MVRYSQFKLKKKINVYPLRPNKVKEKGGPQRKVGSDNFT